MTTPSLSGLDERDMAEVVSQLVRFEDNLRGARILLTGATGWFGTWLLDTLIALDRSLRLGLKLVAVSRAPASFAARHPSLHAASQVEWIEADVRLPFVVDGRLTHVIHAATDASAALNHEDPGRMHDTIVTGTHNVLAAASMHVGVRILLVSSGAVYGPQPADVSALAEDRVVDPAALDRDDAYANGKRAAERLAVAWQADGRGTVTIARCFAFVGPHMPFDTHFAIGNFIRDAQERGAIVIRGDGTPLRSYLYMTDLVVWLVAILVDGAAGRAYNVGSDDALSIAALARRCGAATGRLVEVIVEGRHGEGRNYVPAVARARSELALAPRVQLDAAIARTVAWRSRVLFEATS